MKAFIRFSRMLSSVILFLITLVLLAGLSESDKSQLD